ncbi:MAG: sigma-70 family RNA polymerase sigma factor [Elusimicrobiota bacterium]
MGREEDSEWVRRARGGDRDAFAALVRGHHVRILRLCLSMLRDPSDAEDAAQEAFLKAYKSLDRFAGDCAFSTWLHRIAANYCLDLLRRASRRRTESLDAAYGKEGGEPGAADASPEPDASLEAADFAARALAGLPEDYRLILVLRETQGLSYLELAQALECSLDSVKARLRRARAALQDAARHFHGRENV